MNEINHSHYKNGSIQPVTYIESNDLNFCEGNVIKYVTRWCFKNGAQDLCKAVHYALLIINEYFGLSNEVIDDIMSKLEPFNNNQMSVTKDVKRLK